MDRALFERPERTSHISGYAGHRPSHPVFETFGGSGETRAIGTLPESPGPLQPSYNDRIAAPAAKPLNPPPSAAAGLAEISCDSSEDGGSDAGYRGFQLGGASSNAGGSSIAMQRRMKQLMASRRSSENGDAHAKAVPGYTGFRPQQTDNVGGTLTRGRVDRSLRVTGSVSAMQPSGEDPTGDDACPAPPHPRLLGEGRGKRLFPAAPRGRKSNAQPRPTGHVHGYSGVIPGQASAVGENWETTTRNASVVTRREATTLPLEAFSRQKVGREPAREGLSEAPHRIPGYAGHIPRKPSYVGTQTSELTRDLGATNPSLVSRTRPSRARPAHLTVMQF